MISDEVGGPDYIPHYLWKLLIDERYQRQGFGTATLDLIAESRCSARAPVRAKAARSPSTSATASSRPVKSCSTTRCCFGSSLKLKEAPDHGGHLLWCLELMKVACADGHAEVEVGLEGEQPRGIIVSACR